MTFGRWKVWGRGVEYRRRDGDRVLLVADHEPHPGGPRTLYLIVNDFRAPLATVRWRRGWWPR